LSSSTSPSPILKDIELALVVKPQGQTLHQMHDVQGPKGRIRATGILYLLYVMPLYRLVLSARVRRPKFTGRSAKAVSRDATSQQYPEGIPPNWRLNVPKGSEWAI